jgi:hypothetical protein
LEAGRVELVAVEQAAERRQIVARWCDAVDQIHENGVAGVAARLLVGAPGERRLQEQLVKRMPAGPFPEA